MDRKLCSCSTVTGVLRRLLASCRLARELLEEMVHSEVLGAKAAIAGTPMKSFQHDGMLLFPQVVASCLRDTDAS